MHHVKALFYAPFGVGKTNLAKTGVNDPRIMPMLLLNFEAGTLSIQSVVNELRPIRDILRECKDAGKTKRRDYLDAYTDYLNSAENAQSNKIDVLRVVEWDDLGDIQEILQAGKTRYKGVFIDSLTEIGYMVLREITVHSGEVNPSKHDGELSQLQDYGRLAVRMRRMVRDFRDLPVHCFFTALPADVQDEMTMAKEIRPSLTGKLSGEVPAMLDIVGYITIDGKGDNAKRIIHFQPNGRFAAKDRSEGGKLGSKLEVPDLNFPTLPWIFDRLQIKSPPQSK